MNQGSFYIKNLALTLIFIAGLLSSTRASEPAKGQMTGVISDQSTGEGLPYASLYLLSLNDSSFSSGVISDGDGFYQFENLVFGDYQITASFMGYEKQVIEIVINSRKEKLDISLIKKSFTFSEVEVSAEKELKEEGIEKTTVNISKNNTLVGGNAIDVIQSLPSIDIDINGEIQYRGSNKVTMLLNGKPSDLVKSLEQIPADQIEKVEIINNPSAKYEADGMSGIINIVLKSGNRSKKKTTVSLFAGLPETYGGNVGYSGFLKKVSFYVNGAYKHKTQFQTKEHWRTNEGPGQEDYYQFDRQDALLNDLLISTGLNYQIDKKQQIGLSLLGSKKFNSADRSIQYKTTDASGEMLNNSFKDIDISLDNYNIDGELDYRYDFNTQGQNLSANFHYNMLDQSQLMDHTFYPVLSEDEKELQHTDSDQLNNTAVFSLDYQHPIHDSILIEGGYRYSQKDLLNDFSSQSYHPLTASWEQDTALGNQFHYLQKINAAYINMESKLKCFNLQIGLRGEYTANNQYVTAKEYYFDIFPSARLLKELDEHLTIYLSYNRRINRPNLKMINPYTNEYADILNMHVGNPDLKPEYVNSIEGGTQYHIKKASGSLSIYYRNIDQAISRIKYAANDSAFRVTFLNLDKAQLLGAEMSLSIKPFKWWQINGSANIFYSELKGEHGLNIIDKSHYAWTGSLSQSWKLAAQMGAQFSLYYRSELPDVMGTYIARYYADFAIHKKILKNKGKIIFKISDLFNNYRYGLDMTGIDDDGYVYSQKNRRKNESQYFILSFVYNLQSKEKKKNKENFFLEEFGK